MLECVTYVGSEVWDERVRNLADASKQNATSLTVSAWMFNCVGHYNHRYFMLFVVFMWMGTSYVVHCAWSRVFVLLHIDSVSVSLKYCCVCVGGWVGGCGCVWVGGCVCMSSIALLVALPGVVVTYIIV